MKITGDISPSLVLAPRITPATRKFPSLRNGLRSCNGRIPNASLLGSKKPLLRSKRWELSKAEQEKGWLSKQTPVTKQDLSNTVLSPRVCISEQHGLREQKFRVIDDLYRSEVNATDHMTDTYCPKDLDTLVAQVRALSQVGADNLRAWSVDFSNDYKTIAFHESPNEAATICFVNPTDKLPYKAQILLHPFGSRREPANWVRVVTSIQFLARELLALCASPLLSPTCLQPSLLPPRRAVSGRLSDWCS